MNRASAILGSRCEGIHSCLFTYVEHMTSITLKQPLDFEIANLRSEGNNLSSFVVLLGRSFC